MNLRRLLIWACIYFSLLVYVLAFEKPASKPRPQSAQRGDYEKVFDVKQSDVSSVTISSAGKTVTLGRRDLKWLVTDPAGAQALPEQCESMVSAALDTVVLSVIEEKPAGGLQQFGLDKPEMVIAVTAGDGKQTTLQLGNKSPSDVSLYGLDVERSRIVLVGTYISFSVKMFMENIKGL